MPFRSYNIVKACFLHTGGILNGRHGEGMDMYLELRANVRTALADGTLVLDSPKHMATEFVYSAKEGDRIRLSAEGWLFAVALYSPRRDEKYMYTYSYQKESNWTEYTKNLTPDSYGSGEYAFDEKCFFRVCLRRADGQDISQEDKENRDSLVEFITDGREETDAPKPWFAGEIEKTAKEVRRWQLEEGAVTVALLGDTHYTVNGTFTDTEYNIKAVHTLSPYDAIIHLGDLTDGLVSKRVTAEYAGRVMRGLQRCEVPLYITIGNHDTNYFGGNQEPFDEKEQISLYGGSAPDRVTPWYCADMGENLRLLFLSSFNAERPVRYGFEEAQLNWVKETLKNTEKGRRVIVFCHDAPTAELDYWSFYIWNGEKLLGILEEYQAGEGQHILAYIHGHTHADYVCGRYSFPIISVGCSKCEYYTDKKPAGFFTPERKPDTVTQELWDVMVVDPEKEQLHLIRFGAGADRHIDCRKRCGKREDSRQETGKPANDGRQDSRLRNGKPESTRKRAVQAADSKENLTVAGDRPAVADRGQNDTGENSFFETFTQKKRPAIWAHRGVSGHAPENTLPAFDLAARMGCDGVELDVQMTRDGELIVVHDERIDRVSDGQGFVRDFTWKELRKYNFNLSFPAYGKLMAPSLEEVYGLLKDTDLSINLELKNSVYFYEGMEEKVLELAHRMGMEKRILYSSFNHYSMKRVKELEPEADIAFLYADGFLDMAGYAKKNRGYAIHPAFRNLGYPALLEDCRREGIRVHVWTVDEEADLRSAAELLVDAVITNYPERAIEAWKSP